MKVGKSTMVRSENCATRLEGSSTLFLLWPHVFSFLEQHFSGLSSKGREFGYKFVNKFVAVDMPLFQNFSNRKSFKIRAYF